MNHFQRKKLSAFACLFAGIILAGCHKKAAAPPPPPPPPSPAPTASISVSPAAIEPGQSATLTWHTTNATDASITGLGPVDLNGSRSVSPSASQSYTLTAKGPGGSVQESARLTVNQPPPPPVAAAPSLSDEQLFEQNVKDVYFDYDKYALRSQDSSVVDADAAFLTQHPAMKLVIEGHCDERGSEEYNIALGQSRGESLQSAFTSHGIDASRIRVISLGKEKPFCSESNEQCWQQNRRDHIRLDR